MVYFIQQGAVTVYKCTLRENEIIEETVYGGIAGKKPYYTELDRYYFTNITVLYWNGNHEESNLEIFETYYID